VPITAARVTVGTVAIVVSAARRARVRSAA
jgi:hypothetical protein